MAREISFFNFSSFVQELILDNATYRFRIHWNGRGSFFSLTITDIADIQLVSGMKLLLNSEPLHLHPDRSLPPGQLWVVDTTENNAPIGVDDFINERLKLVYVEESELAAV